jgi:hypothetical protein
MYRQATQAALGENEAFTWQVISTAYDSLLAAWKDYLAHDNHGRPVVFIGHAQGAAMLIKLLRSQIDPSAQLRQKMVSAIILGGNVQVAKGRDVGGSVRHIPTSASATETGCVIAYSTFASEPGRNTVVGRPAGSGCQHRVGAGHSARATGGLRQSGDLLVEGRRSGSHVPDGRAPDPRGLHPLVGVPPALHGPVHAARRCRLVRGPAHPSADARFSAARDQ